MKLYSLILLALIIVTYGCSGSNKVHSLSDGSEKLSATEPINEREQKIFKSVTQHGDEMVFRYGQGAQAFFFKTSKYCYSYGEDALKFLGNDSKSVISIPMEKIQPCVMGVKHETARTNGQVFWNDLSNGAATGFAIGFEGYLDFAETTLRTQPVFGSLLLAMLPVGALVGTSVGVVVGGTIGLVGMGINSANGELLCRDYSEAEKIEFLEAHFCFKP